MVARQFIAEAERLPDYNHVLLITTGSVASIKAPLIVSMLLQVCPPSWNPALAHAVCKRSTKMSE
jgi:hypothetical protein